MVENKKNAKALRFEVRDLKEVFLDHFSSSMMLYRGCLHRWQVKWTLYSTFLKYSSL